MKRKAKDGEVIIRVRDRRTQYQFSIHNLLIDEWYPIIGVHGYALYSLYVRMASRDDERCYPSVRLIRAHMGMSASTISDYNRLLRWCGLIHVESGGQNRPNDYYILDIPSVTPATMQLLIERVEGEERRRVEERLAKAARFAEAGFLDKAEKLKAKESDKFCQTVLKRLLQWRPISSYWQRAKGRPQVIRPEQMQLFGSEAGDPRAEHADPAAEVADLPAEGGDPPAEHSDLHNLQGVREADQNNPKEQSLETSQSNSPEATNDPVESEDGVDIVGSVLGWMGFNGRLSQKDKAPTVEMLLAWAIWVKLEESAADGCKNSVGVARASWRRGAMPGGGVGGLAKRWLALDEYGRRALIEAAEEGQFYGRIQHSRALEKIGVSESMAKLFYKVWLATSGEVAPPLLMPSIKDEL